jgi:Alkaline phosphatase PhoX/WD40-like Beta Propeller Repeat
MDRRSFFRLALASAGAATTLPRAAMAGAQPSPGGGPYGSIEGRIPDANGLLLPEGFTSRVVAVAGQPVGETDYLWHVFPDGGAVFADESGDGWTYVSNSEVFVPLGAGGASAVRFGPDAEIVDAYRVLDGTSANCAGGPTPWGTWLSCEESIDNLGQVWECDPTGARAGVALPALGRWRHEAAAVDPDGEALYLTEDDPAGRLYRFTPDSYPDLAAGRLEAAVVDTGGAVTWVPVADPSAGSGPVHDQVPEATVFPGNEGIWYHDGTVVFTSKGDNRVHAIDLEAQQYSLLWDGASTEPLGGVDNVMVAAGSGDVFVAEDGGNMELVLITPEGDVVPFARVTGHDGSEVTGPAFSPDGTRLYLSSQRGPTPGTLTEIAGDRGLTGDSRNGGVTFEITGPFRDAGADSSASRSPATTLAEAAAGGSGSGEGDDDGPGTAVAVGGAAVAVLGTVGAGAWWLRRRGGGQAGEA